MPFSSYPIQSTSETASYVTAVSEPQLTASRIITAGPGIQLTDTGDHVTVTNVANANNTSEYVLVADDPSLVNARVIRPGPFISITDSTTTITIAATGVAPDSAGYITFQAEAGLTNERQLTIGPNLTASNDGTYFAVGLANPLSNLILNLPTLYMPVTNVATDYGVTSSDFVVLVDATIADTNITLPSASGITGRGYAVKKVDASSNHVVVTAPQTIDALASQTLRMQHDCITLVSNGSAWYIT